MNETIQLSTFRPPQHNPPARWSQSAGARHTASAHVRHLHKAMSTILADGDRHDLTNAFNDYHQRRNVFDFVQCLKLLLDTPAKKQIVPLLRRVIPQKDHDGFDVYMRGFLDNEDDSFQGRHTVIQPFNSSLRVESPLRGRDVHRAPPPEWPPGGAQPQTRSVCIRTAGNGLGFSIRGGAEHGIGIYVSFVDPDSSAATEGLLPGDQITSVNGTKLKQITHQEAVKILKKSKKLDLVVRNVSKIPGSYTAHQTYLWVDGRGRQVSPPPEVDSSLRYESQGQRKSGLMLLKGNDERKVNFVVKVNESLGLMVRGGSEYGLGIYVTGVDHHSVSEIAGLKVGDQIMDVNGESFLDISHADACKVLKSSKHMILTIKDVGRLPYAKTTVDQTQWLPGHNMNGRIRSRDVSPVTGLSAKNMALKKAVFSRGAGSQLMLENTMIRQQRAMIEDQTRQLLNDEERQTMNYYLNEYISGNVSIKAFVLALSELLNTQAKFSLMSEVRGIVSAKDIDKFDTEVLHREVEAMKARNPHSGDRLSIHSFGSLSSRTSSHFSLPSSLRDSFDGSFSHIVSVAQVPTVLPPGIQYQPDEDEARSDTSQINDDIDGLPDFFTEDSTPSPPLVIHRIGNGNILTSVDVHNQSTSSRKSRNGEEDSGVDMYSHSTNNSSRDNHRPQQRSAQQQSNRVPLSHPVTLANSLNEDTVNADQHALGMEEIEIDISELYSKVIPKHKRPIKNGGGQGLTRDDHSKSHSAQSEAANRQITRRPGVQMGIKKQGQRMSGSDVRPERPVSFQGQFRRTASADSLTTEGSNHSQNVTMDVMEKKTKRHYSDPTHHVPKEQQKTVEQKKKTSEQLLDLKNSRNEEETFKAPPGSRTVTVYKSKPTLGIAIEGGANTRQPLPKIINIQPGGSAYESEGLKVGHVILAVDDRPLDSLEHREVARAIAESFKNKASAEMNLVIMDL